MVHTLKRTIGAACCCIASFLMLVCVGISPATGAQNSFEYRVNSGPWSSDPPALFEAQWAPVPGSTRATTFEVRSLREIPTVLTVHASQLSTGNADLSRLTTLQSADQRITFESVETCAELAPQTVLQPGEIYTLPLVIMLAPELTAASNTAITFQLELSLSDGGPATHANGCPMDPVIVHAYPTASPVTPTDQLEFSGSSTPRLIVTGALMLTVAGVITLIFSSVTRSTRAQQTRS